MGKIMKHKGFWIHVEPAMNDRFRARVGKDDVNGTLIRTLYGTTEERAFDVAVAWCNWLIELPKIR